MKNKTLLLLTVGLFLSMSLFAQKKVDRYCKIYEITYASGKNKGDELLMNYGKKENFDMIKDASLLQQLEKVNELKDCVDAINYMGDLGWTLVSIIPQHTWYGNERDRKELIFKKTFDIPALQ